MALTCIARSTSLAVAFAMSLGVASVSAADTSDVGAEASYCDLIGLDELSGLGSVQFDTAIDRGPSCIYSHGEGNQSVFVIGAPAVKVVKSMEPGGEDLTLDERQAYLRNGQFFAELAQGSLMVQVSLEDGSASDSEEAFQLATRIIEVIAPRLDEQHAAAVALALSKLDPSLCDLITADELNALSAIHYAALPVDADPEACSYGKSNPEGGLVTLDFRVYPRQTMSIDTLKTYYPAGREVTVAGQPAWAFDGDIEAYETPRLSIARDAGLFEVTLDYFEEGATQGVDPVDHVIKVAEVILPRLEGAE